MVSVTAILGVATAATTAPTGVLFGISTRGYVGTGDNVLIGGFTVSGGAKKVTVSARGPSMAGLVPGTLADPVLQIFSGSSVIASNDNWQTGNCPTDAPPTRRPTNEQEACIAITLNSGNYTAIVSGAGGTTGIAIVEVYTDTPATFGEGTWLVNNDIAPGIYRAISTNVCTWERLSGFSGNLEDIIASDEITTSGSPVVVTIEPSDAGFHSTGCGEWTKIS